MPIYWDIFKKFKGSKEVYIETGSLQGDSIQKAIESGYNEIHSIDVDPSSVEFCRNRFKDDKRVTCHLGDSSIVLAEVLKQIGKVPSVIFLDAHFGNMFESNMTPLMKELEAIKELGHPDSHVLIDDIRLLKDKENQIPFTTQDIMGQLMNINANYDIVFERGFQEEDILVAYIPSDLIEEVKEEIVFDIPKIEDIEKDKVIKKPIKKSTK